jgi:two-component sensor histidine kinase
VLKPFKFHIILFIALVSGGVVLQILLNAHFRSIEAENQDRLINEHSNAMLRAKAGIDVYAALVSSIRSHIKNSREFPKEKELQSFLKDLIKDLEFNDSIVVSLLNANHEFLYVFSPNQIDAAQLKGKNAAQFRPKEEINELDKLMQSDDIILFDPINLHEGWAGFPFIFSVKDSKGDQLGYLCPIINVKYLLNYFYTENDLEFVHHFYINNKFDISREVVYDGTPIFNSNRDNQYFKNFDVDPSSFISSNLNLFGLDLKVGSAYKKQPKIKSNLALVSYIWYAGLIIFSIITLVQFFRNYKLNNNLEIAKGVIEQKNIKLEKRVDQVQTLIQEIHHRIKNNMMIITSLIDMQSNEYEDPNVKEALQLSKNRIQSMSLIHEKLYESHAIKDINLVDYINQLLSYIDQTLNYSERDIKKEINISSDLYFNGETMMPLALILNELLTNSYKYAFKSGKKNILSLEINKTDEGYILSYDDHGPGIPDTLNLTNSSSLGLQLIMLLAEELHGSVTYKKDDLSKFEIYFKPKLGKN